MRHRTDLWGKMAVTIDIDALNAVVAQVRKILIDVTCQDQLDTYISGHANTLKYDVVEDATGNQKLSVRHVGAVEQHPDNRLLNDELRKLVGSCSPSPVLIEEEYKIRLDREWKTGRSFDRSDEMFNGVAYIQLIEVDFTVIGETLERFTAIR